LSAVGPGVEPGQSPLHPEGATPAAFSVVPTMHRDLARGGPAFSCARAVTSPRNDVLDSVAERHTETEIPATS